MKLSQIKKKFPRAFAEFEKVYCLKHHFIGVFDLKYDLRAFWADLVDFFDKRGMLINSNAAMLDDNGKKVKIYSFTVNHKDLIHRTNIISREQSETQALVKAFEILETKLGEKK